MPWKLDWHEVSILTSEDEKALKKTAIRTLLVAALWATGTELAFPVSKETLQILQELDALQQAMQNLQKTVDSQTAVLRTLIEQATDNVNSMKTTVADLRKATQQNLASDNARFDTLTQQVQALNESLEEAKARLAKLSEQMAQTQNIIQTINTPPALGTPPASGGDAKPAPAVPDADTLYKSGLSYFNGGQYPLAIQAFQQYLQNYGTTDLASNAQFYIGECYYNQGNYARAIDEYNKCLEQYSNGNKLPAAQLKKGYALLALKETAAGERELRSLIRRYPGSHEAELARQRLKRTG